MLGASYDGENCSVARSLELIGERWTLLVIREVFLGHRRFDEIARRLDIARNVLTSRLAKLVEEGVLTKVRYQERPDRYEYRLTEKGIDLWPVFVALLQFGDAYYAPPEGPPMVLKHKRCGGSVDSHRHCAKCDRRLTARDVIAEPGPGARRAAA
jgi:DNA-binding HxlR family transcriptional regulator